MATAPQPRLADRPQLITYADRLAGDLPGLGALLRGPLAGVFGGVHVLPFFDPIDGADAGFDPIDHTRVDPRLGGWADLAAIAGDVEVMADLIVNHVSDRSPPFVDWLARGGASPHDGMFVTLGSVFPDGATEDDLLRIYRPRPGLPFTTTVLGDGSRRLVWTSFTPHQVDLDVDHPASWAYLVGILDRFAAAGVAAVRLDAVGYAVKRAGTSCFLLPETFAFVDRLAEACHERGLAVLVEVHSHHQRQVEIAARVDYVYDFALPPLVLDALYRGTSGPLRRWLALRPSNAVTVLDTHDGIGVIDVGPEPGRPDRPGLLAPDEVSALVEGIHQRSGGTSRLATGTAAANVDLYQVNCTYYDALARDDDRYLLARLLQVLVPGVPQIYYVGLLAGGNDVELLRATGVGRDVNRHRYSPDEVAEALQRPVVAQLLALLRWRSDHPAFSGAFELHDGPDTELRLRWDAPHAGASIDATLDLAAGRFRLVDRRDGAERTITDGGGF